MTRSLKYLLSPIVAYYRQTIANIKLLRKNPTLKIGKNVSVGKTEFGRYNLLSNGVSISNSSMGDFSYLGEQTKISNTTIGKFTCIGPNVKMGLGSHPTDTFVSLHPMFYSTAKQVGISLVDKNYFNEYATKITIGHDVWIGAAVIITKSVNIGNGAVVASGSVLTKDVPPYTIVGGVPAKAIKKRFTEEEIAILEAEKWWDKSDDWLKDNIEKFHNVKAFCAK